MATQRQPLSYYLSLEYPYTVVPDNGSYFIEYPDLPGCMTQVEDAQDIPEAAEEIRALWIEGEYEDGQDIPEPLATEFSGKFVMRVPKSLHRDLVQSAKREGMSLNAYACYLLAERNMAGKLNSRLKEVNAHVSTLSANLTYEVDVARPSETSDNDRKRSNLRVYKPFAA
jgi:predicted RNase H-like HicB family nuclease